MVQHLLREKLCMLSFSHLATKVVPRTCPGTVLSCPPGIVLAAEHAPTVPEVLRSTMCPCHAVAAGSLTASSGKKCLWVLPYRAVTWDTHYRGTKEASCPGTRSEASGTIILRCKHCQAHAQSLALWSPPLLCTAHCCSVQLAHGNLAPCAQVPSMVSCTPPRLITVDTAVKQATACAICC